MVRLGVHRLQNSTFLRRIHTPIKWLCPLEEDDYAEYRDADFLELLGLNLTKRSLDFLVALACCSYCADSSLAAVGAGFGASSKDVWILPESTKCVGIALIVS